MHNLQDIERLVSSGRLDEAVGRLSLMMADVDATSDSRLLSDLYFRRGKLYWRLGRRADATSDYTKASALDPGGPAVRIFTIPDVGSRIVRLTLLYHL